MSNKLKTYTDESLKQYQPRIDAEKQIINTAADSNLKIVEDDYKAQIAETEQSYNDRFDQNEVQRIINERTIAENMANAGLTDSGLNRTQLTANQLSYANNKSKISLEQQRAIDTLARSMLATTTDIKNKKMTDLAGIDSKYYNLAVGDATSRINTETEQAAAIEKARIESQVKLNQQKQDDYDKVMAALGNKNYTDAFKQQFIKNYAATYGLTDAQAQTLFGSPGTKYTYSDDEAEGGTMSTKWDDDMMKSTLLNYHGVLKNANKEINPDDWLSDYVDDLATRNSWSFPTEQAFYNLVLKQTEGTRKFWHNPHVDNIIYTNVDTSAETITDSTGNVWTYYDFRKASKTVLAKEKAAKKAAKNKNINWSKLTDFEKQALIDKVTDDEYGDYLKNKDVIAEAEIQLNRVINSLK